MTKSSKDNLGNRMKRHEEAAKGLLVRRMPTIIRIDGKAFHTFTRGMKKPFDEDLMNAMKQASMDLCDQIQGAKIAYTQSDEISILITDYEKIGTDAWFDYEVQKMVSVSASIFSVYFNRAICSYTDKVALCDSRVFNIPREEVNNYFIWRQQDATKNSISMVAQSKFSSNELHKKSGAQKQEMLFQEHGINFNDLPTWQKRGLCVTKQTYMKGETQRSKWDADFEIPIFTQDRNYIDQYVYPKISSGSKLAKFLVASIEDGSLTTDFVQSLLYGEPVQFKIEVEK